MGLCTVSRLLNVGNTSNPRRILLVSIGSSVSGNEIKMADRRLSVISSPPKSTLPEQRMSYISATPGEF